MDFTVRNLSVLAYAQGFTLWHYKGIPEGTNSTLGNFFGPAADMLTPGDMILLTNPHGGAIRIVADVNAEHGLVQTVALS